MKQFQPPPFRPHRFIRGGHLQTVASLRVEDTIELPTTAIPVAVSDGDSIMLHDDCPTDWKKGDPSLLLIHGLVGCHGANYMVRLASRFFGLGYRVFRMDMRGCGAAESLASGLSHAGRSDDVTAALDHISGLTGAGPISVIAVSLGGALTMRMAGRIGSQLQPRPAWHDRIDRLAVVAPPVDLVRCADNMNRLWMRPYNFYFIRRLLSRIPPLVRQRDDFLSIDLTRRPKTLWEFDEAVTAPLSGFESAEHYYHDSSSVSLLGNNPFKTLVLVAQDDPVVPVKSFTDPRVQLPSTTTLHVERRGGHAGFISRSGESWMDDALQRWIHPA